MKNKYIDAEKLKAEIERQRRQENEQSKEIMKEARIGPGLLSNYGPSSFVLDVELTQEEIAKLGLAPGFCYGVIKIKILCE